MTDGCAGQGNVQSAKWWSANYLPELPADRPATHSCPEGALQGQPFILLSCISLTSVLRRPQSSKRCARVHIDVSASLSACLDYCTPPTIMSTPVHGTCLVSYTEHSYSCL